jgi:C1A family cysteine protease
MNRFIIPRFSHVDPYTNTFSFLSTIAYPRFRADVSNISNVSNIPNISNMFSMSIPRSHNHRRSYYKVSTEKNDKNDKNANLFSVSTPHRNILSLKSLQLSSRVNKVDLRSHFPPPFNQGSLGSCTANALCGLIAYDIPGFMGSRLFLYYNERYIENDIQIDGGALLSDGVESLKRFGICAESEWGYDVSKFTVKPSEKCYHDALNHHALSVKNISTDKEDMKNALRNGYPFVVGIMIYQSFEGADVAETGIVKMPSPGEPLLGGHAVVCVGYDDDRQLWIMRNSWGEQWGDAGYFYLPYDYLTNGLAMDLWCVTKMEK